MKHNARGSGTALFGSVLLAILQPQAFHTTAGNQLYTQNGTYLSQIIEVEMKNVSPCFGCRKCMTLIVTITIFNTFVKWKTDAK